MPRLFQARIFSRAGSYRRQSERVRSIWWRPEQRRWNGEGWMFKEKRTMDRGGEEAHADCGNTCRNRARGNSRQMNKQRRDGGKETKVQFYRDMMRSPKSRESSRYFRLRQTSSATKGQLVPRYSRWIHARRQKDVLRAIIIEPFDQKRVQSPSHSRGARVHHPQ